jgi:carbamoyltransferase
MRCRVVLGIQSRHDASAALIVDGELVAAASEERFRRIKHYFGFPEQAVQYVLSAAGIEMRDVDNVAMLGMSTRAALIRGVRQQMHAWAPRWSRTFLREHLDRRGPYAGPTAIARLAELGFCGRTIAVEHHHGHAAYAYFGSDMHEGLVVTADGIGHLLAGTANIGRGTTLRRIAETFGNGGSLGLFYSAVTDALGFEAGDGEGKTMGLAGYGEAGVALAELARLAPVVAGLETSRRYEWKASGRLKDRMLHVRFKEAKAIVNLIERHGPENVAAAAQEILERRLIELIGNIVRVTGLRAMSAGGGVFLNVKASKRLLDEHVIDSLQVLPNPGDGGLSAGYALSGFHEHGRGGPRVPLKNAYLGPEFGDRAIAAALRGFTDRISFRCTPDVTRTAAKLIASGLVVGWFQGRMEWGPRALGARSVLADPRDRGVRDRINAQLKKREWFMPFAPSVLEPYCREWFLNYRSSPFMNLAFDVKPAMRDLVPAVVHVDGTARPQEVTRETHPLYHATIETFRQLTGIPMILNTSFNIHGLPIVCEPRDAIDHLIWGCVDVLVIGSFVAARPGEHEIHIRDASNQQ